MLNEIKTYFDSKIKKDKGVLNATVQDLTTLNFQKEQSSNEYLLLLNHFPGLSLTMDGASLALDGKDKLVATGSLPDASKPNILSSSDCSVEVVFEQKDAIEISIALTSSLKIGTKEYTINFTQASNGILSGNITDTGSVTLSDLSKVFPKLNINQNLPVLPSYLDILSGLTIDAVIFQINLNTPSKSSASVKISNDKLKSVPLVADILELNDIYAIISISEKSNKVSSVALDLFSTVKIKQKPFKTRLTLTNQAIQKLSIIPEKGLALPTLEDLLALCGFSGSFPNLGSISLTGIAFGVNIKEKKVAYFRINADAHLDLLDSTFEVQASVPNFNFSSRLKDMNTINFDQLMQKLSIDVGLLSGLDIGQLDVGYYNSNYSLAVGVDSLITLPLPVNQLTLTDASTFIQFNPKESTFEVSVNGLVRIKDLIIELQASYDQKNKTFSFKGDTRRGGALHLTDFVEEIFSTFELSLPGCVPDISLSNINLAYESPSGNYSAESNVQSDFAVTLGGLNLALPTARFQISHTAQETKASLSALTSIANKQLQFDLDLIGDKSVSGSMKTKSTTESIDFITMLEQLAPGYFDGLDELLNIEFKEIDVLLSDQQNSFDFIGDIGINIGPASLDIKKLSLKQNSANKSWSISSTGEFSLTISEGKALKITAELSIGKTGNSTYISLKISKENLVAAIKAIGFDDTITKLMTDIINLFEDEITISLTKQDGNYTLEVDHLLKPLVIDVNPKITDDKTLDLGKMSLGLTDFAFTLGSDLGVSMDIALALPSKTNEIFGTDEQGNPEFNILKVYDPSLPDNNAVKLKLAVDSNGLRIKMDSSPFQALNINDGKWDLKLGKDAKYGEIIFDLPDFGYNSQTGSFRVSSGFDIPSEHPLAIPLSPVLNLLDAFGFKGLTKELPDSIPIQSIELTKDNKIDLDKVKLLVGNEVYDVIKGPMEEMNSQFQKLPTRFVDYLNIEIPQSLYFDINVDTQSSVSIDISVYDPNIDPSKQPDKKPIKLLIPSQLGFFGVALKKFSFGELLSGSLFSMEIDAVIDYFDFVSLAASLAVPEDMMKYVSDTHELQTTLTIENLYSIIEYETGFPVPIPLFYDDLGFDYKGLLGANANTHVGFPKPSLNILDLFNLLRNLYKFFTDRNALMPLERPKGMDLDLIIGHVDAEGKQVPIGLELPKYMGGDSLTVPFIDISAYQTFAHFANFCKTFSLKEVLESIDIKYRVNSVSSNFFGLSTEAKWLITSVEEFSNIGYTKLEMTEEQMKTALTILPQDNQVNDDRNDVVLFLYGKLSLNDLLTFSSTFGLIKDKNAFATGFDLSGSFLEDMVEVNLNGHVKTLLPNFNSDPAGPFMFNIGGATSLKVSGTDIFSASGEITITDDGITAKGTVKASDLLPIHADCSASLYMSKSEEKILIKIEEEATVFGLDIAHNENALILSLDSSGFFFEIDSTTNFISNELSIKGRLQIIGDGISGELDLALTTGDTFSIFGIELGMKESSSIKLGITPSTASIDITSSINIPHVIETPLSGSIVATANRNFGGDFAGSLALGSPETPLDFNVGFGSINALLKLNVSTTSASIQASNAHLSLIGHGFELAEFDISSDGSFTCTSGTTLSLGVSPVLLLVVPGISVSYSNGSLSIDVLSSTTPKLTVSGVTYDVSDLEKITQLPCTIPIRLKPLQFGVLSFSEADYNLTIYDNKDDLTLVLLHSASAEIKLLDVGSSLTLDSFEVHANGHLTGQLTGGINLGSLAMASTSYGLSRQGSDLALSGSSTVGVFNTSVTVSGTIVTDGNFSFSGTIQSSDTNLGVAKVEFTATVSISNNPLVAGRVSGTVYVWKKVWIGREKDWWNPFSWEWKDIFKWEWQSLGSTEVALNSDGTFEMFGFKFKI